MRIIAGDFKGRRLERPTGYDVRPTSEKVKEAMFSIVSPMIYDSVCVDLFAGTGNLGLEAISRGAARCYFGDNSRASIELIRRNVEYCKAQEWATICFGDFEKVLSKINEPVDIFFLDPPYKKGFYETCLERIAEYGLLTPEGVIIAEHASRDSLPEEIAGITKLKERKYGTMSLSIYGLAKGKNMEKDHEGEEQ